MASTDGLKCIYVHIFLTKQGRNSNEKCALVGFHVRGEIQCHYYSVLR